MLLIFWTERDFNCKLLNLWTSRKISQRKTFIGVCSLFTWFNNQILNLRHRWLLTLTIFVKRPILDIWLGSDDTSRLDSSSKCVLLWKPSVVIVLLIIWSQSKTKAIPHTVFDTFIKNSSRYKTQKVSWWVFWVGDARNIHKILKIIIGTWSCL